MRTQHGTDGASQVQGTECSAPPLLRVVIRHHALPAGNHHGQPNAIDPWGAANSKMLECTAWALELMTM